MIKFFFRTQFPFSCSTGPGKLKLLGNELHEAVLNKLVVKKFPAFYGMY
jgi:hypothetical protein